MFTHITHLCVVATVLEYAHWWHTLMCVSKVFKYARRQHTYMSKGLTCASDHHTICSKYVFCQNFASSVTCHHSECIAVQLSRNPLGLEDLPQEIHWGWKIYIEPNASDAVLRRRKKAVFCSRLTVAGLESLWSISCLVAYRNCDWFVFVLLLLLLNKVNMKDTETYIGK